MNIQSKSNILSQFQNTRLLFTAKLDFLQNSCDMEPNMVSYAWGSPGAIFLTHFVTNGKYHHWTKILRSIAEIAEMAFLSCPNLPHNVC